jgi:arabinose-5-phosphate isomerase
LETIESIKREMLYEANAIKLAAEKIDENVKSAVDILLKCQGKIVVSGMGKTGIIGRKISATLASTGTTSIFLHAAEGLHGDLGIISPDDVFLAISYTGNTSELVSLIPYVKFNKIPIIAITGNKNSELAKNANVVLDCFVPKEYEPFGLVPTSSTTVALAIGDALAITLIKKKNFQINDFAKFHPGGTIGKKLLLKVKDLMHTKNNNPVVNSDVLFSDALVEMTSKGLGCTSVVENKKLTGIITDGDLRRILSNFQNAQNLKVKRVMTENPISGSPEMPAVDALTLMEDHKITMLPIVDKDNSPVGMLHMHDLIKAGVVG